MQDTVQLFGGPADGLGLAMEPDDRQAGVMIRVFTPTAAGRVADYEVVPCPCGCPILRAIFDGFSTPVAMLPPFPLAVDKPDV